MDEFIMRDPRYCADQEAYHVDREMRRQRHDCVDRPGIVNICSNVLRVDVRE